MKRRGQASFLTKLLNHFTVRATEQNPSTPAKKQEGGDRRNRCRRRRRRNLRERRWQWRLLLGQRWWAVASMRRTDCSSRFWARIPTTLSSFLLKLCSVFVCRCVGLHLMCRGQAWYRQAKVDINLKHVTTSGHYTQAGTPWTTLF